jgi:hypothetical protein
MSVDVSKLLAGLPTSALLPSWIFHHLLVEQKTPGRLFDLLNETVSQSGYTEQLIKNSDRTPSVQDSRRNAIPPVIHGRPAKWPLILSTFDSIQREIVSFTRYK